LLIGVLVVDLNDTTQFQNAVNSLQICFDAMQRSSVYKLSMEESEARRQLILLCRDIDEWFENKNEAWSE
jgi:hypothetical protein